MKIDIFKFPSNSCFLSTDSGMFDEESRSETLKTDGRYVLKKLPLYIKRNFLVILRNKIVVVLKYNLIGIAFKSCFLNLLPEYGRTAAC